METCNFKEYYKVGKAHMLFDILHSKIWSWLSFFFFKSIKNTEQVFTIIKPYEGYPKDLQNDTLPSFPFITAIDFIMRCFKTSQCLTLYLYIERDFWLCLEPRLRVIDYDNKTVK